MTKTAQEILAEWADPETGGTMPPEVREAALSVLSIYEDFCKCYDAALHSASYWPELAGVWTGTVSERIGTVLSAERKAREAAEVRVKELEAKFPLQEIDFEV